VSKSGSHTRKPTTARRAPEHDAVTGLNSRRRNATPEPARFKASLDPEAREALKTLEETIEQLPDMDATRLVQLHQRISAGEYTIDTQRLVDKLIDLERELNK